ncbi:MAG: hypothetical protein ACHQ1D_00350 [Nitrososphaerales archaeon]
MSNVIQLLADAINSKDWTLAEKAYVSLVGELPYHDAPKKKKEKAKPLPSQKELWIEPDQLCSTATPNRSSTLDFTVKKTPKDKRPIRAISQTGKNLFSPEIEPEKDEDYDKINDNVAPVPRMRKAPENVKLVCQECKNKFEVPAKFKKDFYRCDGCLEKLARGSK